MLPEGFDVGLEVSLQANLDHGLQTDSEGSRIYFCLEAGQNA
jgi:hypothetical protein